MADEIKSEIVVEDVISNSETGYIAIFVKMRHKSADGKAEWFGPTKKYGVDAAIFLSSFHGNMKEFTDWVAEEHRKFSGVHPDLAKQIEGLKGGVIG